MSEYNRKKKKHLQCVCICSFLPLLLCCKKIKTVGLPEIQCASSFLFELTTQPGILKDWTTGTDRFLQKCLSCIVKVVQYVLNSCSVFEILGRYTCDPLATHLLTSPFLKYICSEWQLNCDSRSVPPSPSTGMAGCADEYRFTLPYTRPNPAHILPIQLQFFLHDGNCSFS